ncbi:MAG: hypothetical protein V3T70_10590 [Phycisphaerae bacterium]
MSGAPRLPSPSTGEVLRPWGRSRRRLWLPVACLIAGAHFATFEITRLPIATDVRFYLYFAARTADGAVPHRDFFDHKTQLATFAGAAFHKIGTTIGVDPLIAIRAGFLVLAGLGAVLMLAVFRRLMNGRAAAGVIAMLPYLGFAVLGTLPATGNVPKLIMALMASAAALAAYHRRWMLAGAAGFLAFMDWQPGLLVFGAVFVAALFDARGRAAAMTRTLAGLAAAAVPFVIYFAWNGALSNMLDQLFSPSLAKATQHMQARTLGFWSRFRHERIWQAVEAVCPGYEWLVYVGLAGLVLFLILVIRFWRQPRVRLMLIVLGLYHYGIVAFCLLDFQWLGDLFILLHSAAFFGGAAIVVVSEFIAWLIARAGLLRRRIGMRTAIAFRVAALLGLAVVIRPSILRAPHVLATGNGKPIRMTLADQREVCERLFHDIHGKRLAFAARAEMLFLAGEKNGLHTVFWNMAPQAYYRNSDDEGLWDTLARLVEEADADVVVWDQRMQIHPRLAPRYQERSYVSESGAYRIRLYARD